MQAYLGILEKILEKGVRKQNRTGIDTISITGAMFEHYMSEGFPLLTTKKVAYKMIFSELEFFIKGITDKQWLQERKNSIWDEWCSPKIVPYGNDEETKRKMKQERDLGPVYGFQWRHFGADYQGWDKDYSGQGVDQLENIITTLKKDPNSRRMIVTAWNPKDLWQMALPPCHYGFQVLTSNGKVDLSWSQRSVDTPLGLPYNIASYATLLHLIAKEANMEEGKLIGFLDDVHIYVNQLEGIKEQLKRTPMVLPKMKTENFSSIFDWKYTDTKIEGYQSHPRIDFEIAV
jgi:thymidylate synthase